MLWVLIAVVLVVAVIAILSSPWRARRGADDPSAELTRARDAVIALQAARDAKYREIRDAELDHQTGKLSDADFAKVDAGLRAEAIALLRDLDRAEARLARVADGDPAVQ